MSTFTKKVDLREYLNVVLRRGWLIVVPTIIALGLAYVGSMPRFLPPVYQSTAKLQLQHAQRLSQRVERVVDQPSRMEQAERLQNISQSTDFLKAVIEETNLESDTGARLWAESNRANHPNLTEAELIELRLMTYLRQVISVDTNREGTILWIAVKDPYARRALSICEAATQGLIDVSRRVTIEQFAATQEFSSEMVATYKEKLGRLKGQLREYESGDFSESLQHGVVNETNIVQAKTILRSASMQAEDARNRRLEQAKAVEALGDNPERWLHMIRPPEVDDAVARYLNLVRDLAESELQDLTTEQQGSVADGTTTSLRVQLANKSRDLRQLFSDLVANAEGGDNLSPALRQAVLGLLTRNLDARAADERRNYIQSEIRSYESKASELPELEVVKQNLRQDIETNEVMLDAFVNQIAEAGVAEAFEAKKVGGRLELLEPPSLPLEPVSPNRPMILVLAAFGGLFLGVLLVLIVEHHDTTIRDIDQLPEPLRANVLGSLPMIRDRSRKEREYQKAGMKGKTVPVFDYYRDEAPSSFEFRRLVLDLSKGGELPKSIMVTSSERAEGKTTSACMLAVTLARHRRIRTVLVDLDFRRPQVHIQMGLPKRTPGAAEALLERTLNRETIRPTPEGNLFVLPAGSFKAISAESVTPESVRWLVRELLQWFDVVVIDSPPNLAVPDPLVIGQSVEKVLFVVKAGATSRRVLTRGYELQARAKDNLAGVLLNNVRNVMPYYYSYEHYGYVASDGGAQTALSENGR